MSPGLPRGPFGDPALAEHLRAHVREIERPFLLDSRTEYCESWALAGVLLLGDASHTMSPVGAQGINVALRDAVVSANQLVPAVRGDGPYDEPAVQRACTAIEAERRPEIETIHRLVALPPRLVMPVGRRADARRARFGRLATTRRSSASRRRAFASSCRAR